MTAQGLTLARFSELKNQLSATFSQGFGLKSATYWARVKTILNLLMILALVPGTSGCMSSALVRAARGHPNQSFGVSNRPASDQPLPDAEPEPHPSYYAYLILTVPFDAVTLPFQAIGAGLFALFIAGQGHMC